MVSRLYSLLLGIIGGGVHRVRVVKTEHHVLPHSVDLAPATEGSNKLRSLVGIPQSVKSAVNAVDVAASVILELVTHAQNVSQVSEKGILHYRGLANSALAHVDALEQDRVVLRSEVEQAKKEASAKIAELEAEILSLKSELEVLRVLVWPSPRR
jgi:hypothetical protein